MLVWNHARVVMFIVLMLQKLAELPKRLGAFRAMIRQIRHAAATVPISVLKHRCLRHVLSHRPLRIRELINLIPGVVHSKTSPAMTRFYVRDGISARSKANLATNRTGNVSGPMYLHVHIQLVLGTEWAVALMALIVDRRFLIITFSLDRVVLATRNAILTTRIVLAKLVGAEMTIG